MLEIDSVLIVKLGALGDIIHALPVATLIKQKHPACFIAWVVEKHLSPILQGHSALDWIIPVNTHKWREHLHQKKIVSSLHQIYDFRKVLRKRSYQFGLDLQGLYKSALILKSARVKLRIGFPASESRERLSSVFLDKHAESASSEKHIVRKCLAVASSLIGKIEDTEIQFNLPSWFQAAEKVELWLNSQNLSNHQLIALNPSAAWQTKRWSADNYAALAKRIKNELNKIPLILWGPGEKEKERAQKIVDLSNQDAVLGPSSNLQELVEILRKVQLLVAPDTGPLHIAAALGVSTVGLFSASDPKRNGAFSGGKHILPAVLPPIHKIVYLNPSCGACYRRHCENPWCIDKIDPELVFENVKQVLQEKGA